MKVNYIVLKIFLILFILTSCSGPDARKVPVNADERVKKNIEEGRGFRLGSIGKSGGDFMFASANPMWRATMEKIDFAPLSVVDYGGGIIITDWFSDDSSDDQIKISIRFLSNEIRSDAIRVNIHKKSCENFNKCEIKEIQNSTNDQIKLAILKKAAEINANDLAKKKDEIGEYKIPGKEF